MTRAATREIRISSLETKAETIVFTDAESGRMRTPKTPGRKELNEN